jgi:alkyl sulfatase BDS1-like metallo-beta-lactamase superfamily hydrolase
MTTPLEFADALWRGEEHHPFGATGTAEIDPRTFFVASFGNSIALRTGAGLVVVDTGSPFTAPAVKDSIREWSSEPVETIVYTHGHIDHVMGAAVVASSATQVVSHENVPARFDRYKLTAGYNAWINRRQFGVDDLEWPIEYRYPDVVYADTHTLETGGETFELHHGKGETDDATWLWAPERELICCGDFFIWACPNAGNPQKVQRYPREWAIALREMAELGAKALLPGHGPPVVGAERVAAVLNDSAALLEDLVSQTLSLMNEGASLPEVMSRIRLPDELSKPYLRPVYDEPGFIVHNLWRLYGGWFDGDPATLKPATPEEIAAEIAALAGGPKALADRAEALLNEGDAALAAHLVELALSVVPEDGEVRALCARIYEARAGAESSTMSKGIFTWAAREASR